MRKSPAKATTRVKTAVASEECYSKRLLTPLHAIELNGIKGEIYKRDALLFLQSIQSGCADLVFLDPPFNLGKKYGANRSLDKKPETEYNEWMRNILIESVRILSTGGALYLYHIPVWAMRFGAFLESSLDLRHWIAISMKNGFVRGDRLYPAHYALLYFTKGNPDSFKRPKIRPLRCHNCNETVKDYGGYTHIVEDKGLNLSDVWEDLSPVRHSKRKSRDANELPPKLTERVTEISGKRGGLFIDPFSGAGTAVISAVTAGMDFKACDLLSSNCRILYRRLCAQFGEA